MEKPSSSKGPFVKGAEEKCPQLVAVVIVVVHLSVVVVCGGCLVVVVVNLSVVVVW